MAFLEGERKAMENLKNDLTRRIKMLEYSLKQERLFLLIRLKKGDSPVVLEEKDAALDEKTQTRKKNMSNDLLQFTKGFGQNRSREILKSYLKEADALLATSLPSKSKPSPEMKRLDQTRQMIQSSTFLNTQDGPDSPKTNPLIGSVDLNYKIAKRTDTTSSNDSTDSTEISSERSKTIKPDKVDPADLTIGAIGNLSPLKTDLFSLELEGLEPSSPPNERVTAAPSSPDLSPRRETVPQTWNPQAPLRNHYGPVRSVCFHPTDLSLFTASEDRNVCLWRVTPSIRPTEQYLLLNLERICL